MKIIYLHAHKTGGTSIDQALSANFDIKRSIRLNADDTFKKNTLSENNSLLSILPIDRLDYISGHLCWDTYKQIRAASKTDWTVVFSLRDPVAQLYSFFKHYNRTGHAHTNHSSLQNLDTKEKFLNWTCLDEVKHFFNNQTTFASGHSIRRLDDAVTNLLSSNCITTSIDFPDTFSRLAERTGIEINLKHLNKSLDQSALIGHDRDKVMCIQNLDFQLFSIVSAHFGWSQSTH